MKKIGIAFSIVVALLVGAAAARADEIKVLSAGVMRYALPDIATGFERMTGEKPVITYDSAGAVKTRVEKGEKTDVVILPKPDIDALAKMRKIDAPSVRVIARSTFALAVPKGAPKPDISSVEAVKKALLAAKSVAYNDPAKGFADGVEIRRMLERLKIAKQVDAKAKLLETPQEIAEINGPDIYIAQSAPMLASKNYDVVGPLPTQLQDPAHFTWAAGATTSAADPSAAADFVRVLAAPGAASTFKAKGMPPP